MSDIPIAQVVSVDGVNQSKGAAIPQGTANLQGIQVPHASSNINEIGAIEFLTKHQWPDALQGHLLHGLKQCVKRFIIVDDSGSMSTSDGHVLYKSQTKNNFTVVPSTRWDELTNAMRFHAGLAEAAKAPTQFRLLNGSAPIDVGFSYDDDGVGESRAYAAFERSPSGGTPLCRHIHEVIQEIRIMEVRSIIFLLP